MIRLLFPNLLFILFSYFSDYRYAMSVHIRNKMTTVSYTFKDRVSILLYHKMKIMQVRTYLNALLFQSTPGDFTKSFYMYEVDNFYHLVKVSSYSSDIYLDCNISSHPKSLHNGWILAKYTFIYTQQIRISVVTNIINKSYYFIQLIKILPASANIASASLIFILSVVPVPGFHIDTFSPPTPVTRTAPFDVIP